VYTALFSLRFVSGQWITREFSFMEIGKLVCERVSTLTMYSDIFAILIVMQLIT
jgi:hypothetical protein